MRFLLSGDHGLEDIVVQELRERCPSASARANPHGVPGQIAVEFDDVEPLLQLGTIHHVLEVREEAEVETLEDVRRVIAAATFGELDGARSFRVTSTCRGDLGLEKMELQGAAGAALIRRYTTPVDLEDFEIEVRVDLYGRRLVAGVQRTRVSLGNRIRRGRVLRSSLKPTIAASMLRLAGAHAGPGRLIDPMCGAAVIPVEAARVNPHLEIRASDWDAETVETARGTLRNHGLAFEVRAADARALREETDGLFDYIVTDPPHGIRQARRARLTALYSGLLAAFERVLKPGGRIVVIVVKYRVFVAAVERTGLHIVEQRAVASGSVTRRIFVLEKIG